MQGKASPNTCITFVTVLQRRPVDCAYFHERRHGSYRDMVDQSCDTVTKVMHVLGARLSPKSSSYVDTSATKSQSSRRSCEFLEEAREISKVKWPRFPFRFGYWEFEISMRGGGETETASKRDSVFDAECCELPQPSNAFISLRSKNIACGQPKSTRSGSVTRDLRLRLKAARSLAMLCAAAAAHLAAA